MTSELDLLLRQANNGCAPASSGSWERTIMLRNRGDILGSPDATAEWAKAQGFDLLLLGSDFRPRYYCKLRPEGDRKLAHATRVLKALGTDPESASIVPRVWGAGSPKVRLQLTPYLPGPVYHRSLPELSLEKWHRSVTRILDSAETLSTRALDLLPDICEDEAPVPAIRKAEEPLEYLFDAGLLGPEFGELAEVLSGAGVLPRMVQHSDLWPGNVIEADAGWKLIDFEEFGRVQVPLYDAFHLLRTSDTFRRPALADRPWLERLESDDPVSGLTRQLLRDRADRHGLAPAAVAGSLVYYLLELATWFHRRGTPPSFLEPVLAELAHAAHIVRTGRRLQDLVVGVRPPAPR